MSITIGGMVKLFNKVFIVLFAILLITGCSGAVTPFPPTPSSTVSPAPTATRTATALPTVTRTPPTLAGVYQPDNLFPGDSIHTYISEACQYLRDRWTSTNSKPGTVVMVIMFHSITYDPVSSPNQISEKDFRQLMEALHEKGFQAITTQQLAGFLESNAKIPARSVLLVADDRHPREYFDILFRQYWQDWGWPVVNAWISTDLSSAKLWQEQVELHQEGWVDYQAHGVIHNLPMGPDSSEEFIQGELQGSIDRFMEHFGKSPIAIIWPGGGFGKRPVEIARQLGYRLGFTVNPRGPLMYNWIPLGDTIDPKRPLWIPEGEMGDPLLVLPRYWDTDAIIHLDEVIQMGQAAADDSEKNQAVELDYYDIVCSPSLGPIP